jgi:hypothetical protein
MVVKPPKSYIMRPLKGERGEKGFQSVKPLILEEGIHQSIIILILRHSGKGWTGELGGVVATSTLVCKYFTMFLH